MSDPKFRLEKIIFVASVCVYCTPKAHSLRKIEPEDLYIFQVFGFILLHNSVTGTNYLFAKIPPPKMNFRDFFDRPRSTTIFKLTESLMRDTSFIFFPD